MILYGSPLSPFVRKTLAYGAEKGLTFEHKPVGFGSKDPGFLQASPFSKIPGFSDGDFSISDSTAIITYLEAKYPEPPMIPAEPKSRARVIWYEEFADTILVGKLAPIFFQRVVTKLIGREPDLEMADRLEREELPPLMEYMETIAPVSGFLVDDKLTLADLSVASVFVNMGHAKVDLLAHRYPKTAAYLDAILARPSFAQTITAEKAILAG